jgi:cation:H+ antiporter
MVRRVAAVLLLAGAVILYLGAEVAVRGAARVSRALGVPAFALGAVLFGVDVEGLSAAVVASGRGQTAIAAGESFGTILFLFSLALGAALLLAKEPVRSPSPVMVALPTLPVIACALAISDRFVARWEGALLVVIYAAYVALVLLRGDVIGATEGDRPELESPETPAARRRALPLVLLTLGGLALVYVGASLLVAGGLRLVGTTALSAGFVGAAVLGILVSLDEVLLEVLPIRRGEPELATGNLFGTLAAFTAGVPGLAALVRPLVLDGAAAAAFLGAAILYFVVGTAFLARGRAGRLLGFTVLALYAAWLALASRV